MLHIKNVWFLAVEREIKAYYLKGLTKSKFFIKFANSKDEEGYLFDPNTILEAEVLSLIYKIAKQLPPICYQVFKMYYLQDMGYSEIAVVLNINPQTVRNQKTRAIKLLKQRIHLL